MGKGDHIYVDCDFYTHHGIDCGDGTAIHYIGEALKGVITRTSIAEFTSGKQLFVKKYEVSDLSDIILLRAKSRLGENKYDLLFNNCEHFATWCKTGIHESEQVKRVATVAVIGASIGGIKSMQAVSATYQVSEDISAGLSNGSLKRIGGVIRQTNTTQIVACVRETTPNISPVSKLLQIGASASMLNLGVTMMGFAIINHRLNELEQRLKQAQEILNKINRKIDLGYYANFRAALDLAAKAITMKNPETRKSMAINAIGDLRKADFIYTDYTDKELEQGSQIVDEYLLTLLLAYVAEARCYLELEAPDTALELLRDGAAKVRPRMQKYVDLLLTSNPAAYLQPEYKGEIDLRRLTRIYQWSDPNLDENAVFDLHRENLIKLVQDPNKWVASLPSAILDRVEVKGGMFGPSQDDLKREAIKRLPQVLEVIENMIETYQRFEAYKVEVETIDKLGISFQDWIKLAPAENKPEDAELMYIIPDKPLDIVFAS
jgi:Lecithin retinol acyltransferase